MKTQKAVVLLLGSALLTCVVALPKIVHADSLSVQAGGVGVNINDNDDHDHHHHHWLRHEEMDAALNRLQDARGRIADARGHLDRGGHDFGGRRMEAIHKADEALHRVDEAIHAINDAIDYANHHER